MPITGAMQFGGSALVTAGGGTTTLAWGPLRRVQMVTPTVALAEVELPAADAPEFPVDLGLIAFVVVNDDGTNSIHLTDQEGEVDLTLAPGEAAIVSRFYE